MKWSQVKSSQVKSSQVKSSQVKSSQVIILSSSSFLSIRQAADMYEWNWWNAVLIFFFSLRVLQRLYYVIRGTCKYHHHIIIVITITIIIIIIIIINIIINIIVINLGQTPLCLAWALAVHKIQRGYYGANWLNVVLDTKEMLKLNDGSCGNNG